MRKRGRQGFLAARERGGARGIGEMKAWVLRPPLRRAGELEKKDLEGRSPRRPARMGAGELHRVRHGDVLYQGASTTRNMIILMKTI